MLFKGVQRAIEHSRLQLSVSKSLSSECMISFPGKRIAIAANHTSKVSRPLLLGMLKRAERRLLFSSGSGAFGSPAAVAAASTCEGSCSRNGVADGAIDGEAISPVVEALVAAASVSSTLLRLLRPRTPRVALLGLDGELPAVSAVVAAIVVVP